MFSCNVKIKGLENERSMMLCDLFYLVFNLYLFFSRLVEKKDKNTNIFITLVNDVEKQTIMFISYC